MTERIHIGKIIKAILKEKGMSIAEFARGINTCHSNVYHIFDQSRIDTERLMQICMVLNVNIFEMLSKQYEEEVKK